MATPTPRVSAPGGGLPPAAFWVITSVLFAIALLKGLAMPNLWVATHFTFNYSHGVIRRGLVGQVLWLIGGGHLWHYRILAVMALALFVILAIITARAVRRALAADPRDAALQGTVLVFAASPGLVFFVHALGYFDQLGFLLALAWLLLSTRSKRTHTLLFAATAIGVVMAFVHEVLVVMFLPAMAFAMLCHIMVRARDGGLRRRSVALLIAHAGVAVLVPFAAAAVLGVVGVMRPGEELALARSVEPFADFPLRYDAYDVHVHTVTDNLRDLSRYWRKVGNRHYLVRGLLVTAPVLAYFLSYGVRIIAVLGLPAIGRRALNVALFAATLAPLTLNLVGWDSARWNGIATLAGLLCLLSLRLLFSEREPDPVAHRIDSAALPVAAALVVVLSLCTNYQNFLLEDHTVGWFPFDERIRSAADAITSGFGQSPDWKR